MVSRKTVSALTIAAFLASASPQSVAALMAPAIAQTTPTFPVPDSVPAGTAIRVSSGSENMNAISEALRQGFEAEYSGSQIAITRKSAGAAIQDVLNDNADLAAISRPLTDEEKAKGLFAVPVQREKIAVVVGKDNPFSGGLTGSQFAQIFRGDITDWSGVGGAAGPIRMIDRPASSETRQSLQAYPVFKTAAFETGANAIQLSEDEDSTVGLVEALGTEGIGYALVGQLAGQPNLKALELHKTLPSDPNYPFSQPYSFVYAGGTSPAMAAFLGYATGSPGQAALSNAGVTTPRLNSAEGDSATTAAAGTAAGTDGSTPEAGSGDAASGDGGNADDVTSTDAEGVAAENERHQNDWRNSWRDGWWWLLLLLPLAGLGLLIWAASKRGREEKAIDAADSDIANANIATVDPNVDTNDDEIRSSSSGNLTHEVSGAPVHTYGEPSRAPDDTSADYERNDSDRTSISINTQSNIETLKSDSASLPEESESESWLDRAKQRINEAAEQVEDRAANAKDDLTQK